MRLLRSILPFLIGATVLVSCKRFPNPFAGNDRILAEIGDERLYAHDVSSIFSEGMTEEDSLRILRSYVDQWVKKQLKIREAERLFESSQTDIDRMVEEYRNSLLTNRVDQFYVDKRIDTLFTDEQIREYYDRNKSDFILDKTLLKACIVRIPRNYSRKNKLRELMLTSPGKDRYQDLVDLCIKNDFDLTELNGWTDFSTFLSLLPAEKDRDYDYLLASDKVHEMETKDYLFYIRIFAFRKTGDYAPPESVADVIKRVIFNKRKEEIVRTHEDSLYRNAIQNKEIILNISE